MSRFKRRGRYKERNASTPEVSLTPLIDTVLVLLVIFMMTTPIMQRVTQLNIELPSSSTNEESSEQEKSNSVSVYLDKNKKLHINDTYVEKEKFFDVLEKELEKAGNLHDRVVFVNADKVIPYGVVLQIVDDIKYLGGVKYVALATQDT